MNEFERNMQKAERNLKICIVILCITLGIMVINVVLAILGKMG